MPENPPFTVYRDQLTSLYHGLALWKPNPPQAIGDPPQAIYDKVSIGDVGYVQEGVFIRMFNVILPWDHGSNRILDPLDKGEYCSRSVATEPNAGNNQAMGPDDTEGATYRCRSRGALLSLPHGGHSKDIMRKKAFEDYIRNHVVSWFTWAQENQLGVDRIEELILVSGCTLATSWAVVAFVDKTMEAEISLASRTLGDNGEARFVWSNTRGPVRYKNSHFDPQNPPTTPDQCVFIKGFRAKRILFWTTGRPIQAAAEPPPDDPDNRRDDEIQVTEVLDVPKYRDPLIGVLDYIVEKSLEDTISEDTIAIAHDDDLKLIKDVETLTADAIEKFLREKQMPLCIENGVRKLHPIPLEASQSRKQLPSARSAWPSAGVSERRNPFVRIYDTINAVKVNKGQLSDLARQCNLLLSAVREYSPRLVEAEASTTEADEIERTMEDILVRISGWTRLSDRAAFLRQNQIQIGIEQCYRDLTACTNRFSVALVMAQKSEIQERENERQRNHQELIDMIAKLREETRKLSIPLEASQSHEQLLPPQVVDVDGQLAAPQVVPSPRSKAADHSGKISRVSEDAVIEGSQLLFYIGEWTSDGERTALGRLRDQSPGSQKRFKEWIEASLSLQHRNILNFTGHVTINDVVYSVNPNPRIENGNIREYLRRNPDADRVQLLSEVASGVEFCHEREILHGDLCDKNILINRDGKAIVCGFDLSEFLNPSLSRARWLAPEHITSASVAAPTEKADIWSFGLLCLEVFTGKDPYHGHSDFYVPVLLSQGTHPEHPGSTAVGLSPKMWDLMQSCWQIDPGQRPSMSEIQSTIRDILPRRDVDTSPPNELEARRPTVEMSSLLSPLGLTGIPPVTDELNMVASLDFLGTVDQQTDTQAPNRRRASDSPSSKSRPLPPLLEDPLNPDIHVLRKSAPSQSTTRGERNLPHPFATPASSALSSDLGSVESSSSYSTWSTSGSSRLRRLFGNKRSQITPDTSPGTISDLLLPDTPGSSNSSLHPGAPPARPFPNRTRTWTMLTKKSSKMAAPQSIDLPQSRNWEPVSPVVLGLMEMAAGDSECLLRLAIDGSVSAGNLEGLVYRVITDIENPYRSDHFRATFLTIYQLFATSERLFDILKRRFESSELNPARSWYPILFFIESWLKKGFADEDLKCTSMIKELVFPLVDSETISEKMEAEAKEIARLIEDPDYVPLRQPKDCIALRSEPAERPQGVTPTDLAAALTVVEGDRFKCITYWDYVNFTRCPSNVRRIEVFNIVHDLVKVWVQTTVLEPDFLDERMEMYEEWIYTAKACRALNNFSSTSAIVLALTSPLVKALALTCESNARPDLHALAKELTLTDGEYQNTLQKVATRDLIPCLDLHLSTLNSSFAHSNPVVEVDGHPLIDFKCCSEIAEQIDSLVQYSPPRTHHTMRPDLLAYVEYSLKSCRSDDLLRNAGERSARLAKEERGFDAQRKKMIYLGFGWSPPRRRK